MQSQRQTFAGDAASPAPPPGTSPDFLKSYQAADGRYDECCLPTGKRRPNWRRFCEHLARFGSEEFSRRWEHSQRLLRENGIAYNAHRDSDASARPWQLDPLPMLITEDQWSKLSAGVVQRAELLQLVLADLFGPQRLIKEGILPAHLLFGHPGFRLPFHGQAPAGDSWLHYYAADLGRAPDGSWWVLADRTEAPSGIGFALENRVVVSRMFPEIFRTFNVSRLAPFFLALKAHLQEQAPAHRENPRIVILSRGPKHENYFEDAYLARYLGYSMVHGNDLTVRSGVVWLKTLDGLLPVDVLLRRPNSEVCDPLEFSDETAMGVAGLLNADRGGSIAVMNPLGSGVVESPVFMAFMPRLCKFLLQQELALPGVATWWCGEPDSLRHVLANLNRLAVSPAFRRRGGQRDHLPWVAPASEADLRKQIQANPQAFIAQEKLALSTGPIWNGVKAVPANHVLRSFAVASGASYEVMPGGLARTSEPTAPHVHAVPAGSGSKDAWILSIAPVGQVTLLASTDESIIIRRTGSDLPSRVADNIYWLGRQIERADASARLLRTLVLQLTSETANASDVTPAPLLRAMAYQGQIEPGFALDEIRRSMPEIGTALPRLIFDQAQMGSLRSVIDRMFHLASLVRDRLSTDSWRILAGIDQRFRAPQGVDAIDLTDVLNYVNGLIVDLAAIEGLCMESMIRSHVFRFLDIGRRLERAMQTVNLVRSCFIDYSDLRAELLEAVLEIADSMMTYRSRYLTNLQITAVLDLILTDETNPRSIAFQLQTLQQQVEQLPRDERPAGLPPHERLIMSLVHLVRMTDIREVCHQYQLGQKDLLLHVVGELDRDLPGLSNAIVHRYLVHAGPTHRFANAQHQTP